MGLVNSIGAKAMRPPVPATYEISAAGGGGDARFEPPWAPATDWERANGCPIRMRHALPRAEFARRAAALDHRVALRPSGSETIAILHVFLRDADDGAADDDGDDAERRRGQRAAPRPTLLYSKGNSFDMGMLR